MGYLLSRVPSRGIAILMALACAQCLLVTYAAAQTCCAAPKDEIFGGYSWSHPNGYGDLGYKVLNISEGFDFSNTYYLPSLLSLGVLVNGSGHLNGGTQPRNPYNPGNKGTDVGYILTGLQYKYHTTRFSPFARVFVGTANLSPDCCGGTKWNAAGGGGGGVDLCVTQTLSIRLAQVDYIYSKYDQRFQSGYSNGWNSIRLASGIVLCLGCFSHPPPPSCSASATPTEVWAGEPVTVTTTGAKFNPKHTVTYDWTANGGQMSAANGQSATINTTGMAPGSYSASSTITDPKMKKMNLAWCAVPFNIKQPQPPTVSCSASPTTIAIGERSTITLAASDPQGWSLTYSWSSTGGQLSGTGASATLTTTNADLGKTITVTGTASDGRTPQVSSSCTVMTKLPGAEAEKCITIMDWGECTFEKNPKKPWRVDNECKDTLDKVSLRLQQMPTGKLDIVGYTNKKEAVKEPTLGAQRAVNVKYYLTTDGPNRADAARIRPREGGTEEGQAAHFYFVPEGSLCSGQLEEGIVIDESAVQGQSRMTPAPKKGNAKAKPSAPPTQ